MSKNPPPVSIQAILPREEAIKLVFWQSPDEALFPQEDIAIITGHTVGMLTLMRSGGGGPPVSQGQKGGVVREVSRGPLDAQSTPRTLYSLSFA